MNISREADAPLAKRLGSSAPNPLMWITPGRVLYAGLLGRPSVRRIGGTIVYVAQQAPIRVSIDSGEWEEGDVLAVPPYLPHRIACDARSITDLIVEPETVDRASLPAFMRDRRGAVHAPEFADQVRRVLERLQGRDQRLPLDDAAFDELLFGQALPRATLDPRIAQVLADIAKDPGGTTSAEDYAARVHLSFSRFVHLFKDEVGVPLRTFRTWKRARSLLDYVTQNANLADIAQHTGYPDSSHFSHSIRQVFGLTPKDVFKGSRKLELHGQPAAGSATARRRA